jgi:hypothetical protein
VLQPLSEIAGVGGDSMIRVFMDGDKWCALLGDDLQSGLAGFGDTPAEALQQLVWEIERYGWNWGC